MHASDGTSTKTRGWNVKLSGFDNRFVSFTYNTIHEEPMRIFGSFLPNCVCLWIQYAQKRISVVCLWIQYTKNHNFVICFWIQYNKKLYVYEYSMHKNVLWYVCEYSIQGNLLFCMIVNKIYKKRYFFSMTVNTMYKENILFVVCFWYTLNCTFLIYQWMQYTKIFTFLYVCD